MLAQATDWCEGGARDDLLILKRCYSVPCSHEMSDDALISCLAARAIRRLILDAAWHAGVGHIGSCLSVADIVATLYGGVLRGNRPDDPERDRFVLSKGHAALALYAALHLRGWIDSPTLLTYCGDGTRLGVHPDVGLPGIDFSTGSLGHGLSAGIGMALGARLRGSPRRTFVLLSDAECNEGAVWEAIMFAAHHRLSNLIAIVDMNGQQALGYTRDVLDLGDLRAKWQAFGWDAREVDGHDVAALQRAIAECAAEAQRPHVIVARTVAGKGVSFMERRIDWHYLPMTREQYDLACREVDQGSTDAMTVHAPGAAVE
jgi:transketolase